MKIFVTGLAALLVVSSAAAQGRQHNVRALFAFGPPQRNDLPGAYGLRFDGMIVSIDTPAEPAETYVELPLDCEASQSKEKTSGVLIQCRMRGRGAHFITEHRCDRASIAASDVIVPDCAVTVHATFYGRFEYTGKGRTMFDNIKIVNLFWSRN